MAQYPGNFDAISPVHINDPRTNVTIPSTLVGESSGGTSVPPGDILVTQIVIETSVAPTDATIRVTQVVVETSISIIQVYQLSTWEDDPQNQVPQRYFNYFQDQDAQIFPFAAAVKKQPKITIMT